MSPPRSAGASGPLLPAHRARIHAVYRALARSLQLAEVSPTDRMGWRTSVLGAWTLCDVAMWRAIRRGSVPLPVRMGVDLLDVATWTGPLGAGWTAALTGQAPTDLECGLAFGIRGLGFPAAAAIVSSVARRWTGQSPDPLRHASHAGAVIGGIVVRRGERARMARARRAHAEELSAKEVRAFLAGQSSVAMGAGSVIDQLKPIALLLDADAPGSVLNRVRAGWKESLAEQTRHHTVFLDSAIRVWQHDHNDHPDLHGFVHVVELPEGDGTFLLSGEQARTLARLLESRELRGQVRIELPSPHTLRRPQPGHGFELIVNGSPLHVPPDSAVHVDRFNPAPSTFLFGAWAALMPVGEGDGALPPPHALVCSLGYLAAAVRYRRRSTETSIEEALWAAIVLGSVQGFVCANGCRVRRHPTGSHMFHGTFGIAPAGLMLAASRSLLSKRQQRAALVALGTIAALSYRAAEGPKSLGDLATAIAHPVAAMLGMDTVSSAAALASERLTAELSRSDEEIEGAAFERGRRHVLDLATAALADAEQRFATCKDLDEALRANVAHRLDEIYRTAAALELGLAPSPRDSLRRNARPPGGQ